MIERQRTRPDSRSDSRPSFASLRDSRAARALARPPLRLRRSGGAGGQRLCASRPRGLGRRRSAQNGASADPAPAPVDQFGRQENADERLEGAVDVADGDDPFRGLDIAGRSGPGRRGGTGSRDAGAGQEHRDDRDERKVGGEARASRDRDA